jgi:ferredoxin
VVADGLLGPQVGPMNLAGVLPWTYWRALAVVALLAAGNVFCMACPFMLPRDLGRRLLGAGRAWPRVLRTKWLAVALVVLYLWGYEALAPWDSPRATAAIVLAYFAAAFAVDGLFRGASFCKWVCPIGQFHFVHSTLSPFEVTVRRPAVCTTCTTQDCIRGNATARGCELELFQPEKTGNLDCTFCLDCVHACPHDNVGILATAPAAELARDPHRSSLRRLSRRPDVAALALVLAFGAFVNAGAMVGPVVAWLDGASRAATSALLLVALAGVPAAVALACAALGRALGAGAAWREAGCRFALALVPLGFGMWCAHFLFHAATGAGTALPVLQRAAADLGIGVLGAPAWHPGTPAGDGLVALQLLLLDAGLLASLWVGWRIALDHASRPRRALGLLAPWGGVAVALWVAGVWIVCQPMAMRGTMVH